MIINDIENYFSIYIFILFVVLFLIFIVYFLLKNKDSNNKEDEIKYDWYFYLRISIIILVFLLLIYSPYEELLFNQELYCCFNYY